MKSEIVHVDSNGHGIEEAVRVAEEMAAACVSDDKMTRRIRLLAEESLETVRHMAGEYKADFRVTIDDGLCEIRIKLHANIDSDKRGKLKEAMSRYKKRGSISDQIRGLLEQGLKGGQEEGESLADMGMLKADTKDFGKDKNGEQEMYVWSMQAYTMAGLLSDEDGVSEDTASRISSSIIANLSDDIRVYVFRDSAEMIVQKRLTEEGDVTEYGYPISPEFERLKSIPVATSGFQVKMVQLLYGRLMKKQTPTKTLNCRRAPIRIEAAPSGKIECLIYEPKDLGLNKAAPCILLLHGGAFVFPALPYHYNIAREMADSLHCRVIMPDYDLAPRVVPPTQQEEAFALYNYILEHAGSFGIDKNKVAVMGDSAGGTLCAALTLMIKQRKSGPQPKAQLLFYPSLDARLESESMKKYLDVPVVNAVAVKAYYRICDFDHFKGYRVYASPVEANSFEGLPDAYIETAEFDCLHDDGVLYANLLQDAGCNVVLNETKGTVHAFDMETDSSIRKEAMAQRIAFLREVFA